MTVVDRLRRGEDLEQALSQLVVLLQADELDFDDLDQAVRHADTLLAGTLADETPSQDREDCEGSAPVYGTYMSPPGKPAPPSAKRETRNADPGKKPSCTVDGCERKHQARGYCRAHYKRVVKYGDPMANVPLGQRGGWQRPLIERAKDPADGSGPPGGPSGSKPDGSGSTPDRPAKPVAKPPPPDTDAQPASGHVEAHMDNMIGAVSGPYRTFTLVDQRGNDVAVEQHPEPDDPSVWAAVLAQVHTAVHDEPVVVNHEPAGGGNGQALVQHHQAGIR